jgi:hypothetical protein
MAQVALLAGLGDLRQATVGVDDVGPGVLVDGGDACRIGVV